MMPCLTRCSEKLQNRKLLVDTLGIFFGIGTWIGINSIHLQMPLLVANAPEGWNLPSIVGVVFQMSNIGTFSYTLIQRYSKKKFNDEHLIYAIYTIAIAASFAMIFSYQKTIFVAGEYRSVPLMIISFFLALVGCTSSVLFMPYMGRFPEIYLITYLVGEGLSGLFPSILALIQGVGGNPQCVPNNSTDGPALIKETTPALFDPGSFFIFVVIMLFISGLAFLLLNKLKVCRNEYVSGVIEFGNKYKYDNSETVTDKINEKTLTVTQKLSTNTFLSTLILMGVVSFFAHGVFPGIMSFSCLPYGYEAYHLSTTLSTIANPVACTLAVFLNRTTIRQIWLLCGVTAILTAYVLVTSISRPLMGTQSGVVLIVSMF